jgi:hypothetical protein
MSLGDVSAVVDDETAIFDCDGGSLGQSAGRWLHRYKQLTVCKARIDG